MICSLRYLNNEKLKSRRILARRDQIIMELLSPKSQLICATQPKTEYIWMDSNFLRRFFSCQDDLEDLFQGAHRQSSVLRLESFVCEHSNGLHPRVAREGTSKLFPVRSFYHFDTGAIFHTAFFSQCFQERFSHHWSMLN